MLIDSATLILFIPTVFILVITPGPDLIFVTANSIASGKKGGIASALGCTSGAFSHAILAAFGFTAIVATWQPAYEAIRVAGALYLAFIGLKMLLSKEGIIMVNGKGQQKSFWILFRQGFFNNIMNPKAILFSMTFLPQFADPNRGPIWVQMIILGVILSIIMISVEIPIAFTSGYLGQWFVRKAKAAIILNKAMGAFLIGLAIWVFRSRKFAQ